MATCYTVHESMTASAAESRSQAEAEGAEQTSAVGTESRGQQTKRAFVPDEPSSYQYPSSSSPASSPKKADFCLPSIPLVAQASRKRSNPTSTYFDCKRRNSEDRTGRRLASSPSTSTTSMQVPPSPRNFAAAPMPSYMTVYHEEARSNSDVGGMVGHHAYEPQKDNLQDHIETSFNSINAPFALFHQQRDSTSTSASESSDSSPTTTISTLDSSSVTEPSPGTDSPSNSASPISHSMDALMFRPLPRTFQSEPPRQPFFQMERPATPAKKDRNLKNLAVNTTSAYNLGRAVMSAPVPAPSAQESTQSSEPSSPSFVKPPTPPRRKLALGLSIKTPANSTIPRLGVPPTPSIIRPNTLRHFQSSPSLPLYTPGHAPMGGMTLPPQRPRQPAPRGFADIPQEDEEEEAEQNFDVPQSQEMKPDSYPNGPIRIYESGVDLYFEPDQSVASKYDVIMNVASEVKNPFIPDNGGAASSTILQPLSNFGIITEDSEATSSPDTPKATPISTQLPVMTIPPTSAPFKPPEYIHIPWEHNTDIVPDLPRLVRLIDDRVKQGKTVLVHCQCGVSRSASLIVAYGLYKNPGLSVQEAYDAVKKRSKWIGPNMNLIMQLQEFRSGLLRNSRRDNTYQAEHFTMPRKLSTALSSASTSGSFDAVSGSVSGPATPRTAPLGPELQSPSTRARSGSLGPFSAAPVEQGEGSFWDAGFRRSWGSGSASSGINLNRVSIVPDTPWVDPMGHVVPMVTVIQHPSVKDGIKDPSPPETSQEFSQAQSKIQAKSLKRKTPNFSRQLPLRRDYDMDTSMIDPPSFHIPDILSPRAEEFNMVGIDKQHIPAPDDSFGILSPIATEFPIDPFASSFPKSSSVTLPKEHYEFSHTTTATPKEQSGFAFFPTDWTGPESLALQSPTTTEFNLGPERIDSLRSRRVSSNGSRHDPVKALKTKYSSPNLQDSKRLHAMQDEIEASLPSPKRHFDDLDALMSPRVVEFTLNPWDELLSVKPLKQSEQATTPTSSKVDPRSPAQHGISPIVRNIFDVL
ncbi:hypothetical protein FKW77_002073 [Venturia effusa]|uniref:protein-tyrosine-phosphatase n=1 Tax=Venturia effusa TaxID=50376 RepID=A0A517LDA9_9PEZI|nr:hypothetical protein FKW77_002073 [Venturia effusa]